MSLVDPDCYPLLHSDERQVCSGCFDDRDLKTMIKDAGAYGSCDFCGTRRAKTVELSYITEHISERAYTFFGKAVDQLPYESAEGGYQGENFTTYELLTEHFEIELPRDDNSELLWAIIAEVGEDQWCAYDWTQLEIHESLAYSWKRFSDMVKHERRFFSKEESVENGLSPDAPPPMSRAGGPIDAHGWA